MHQGTQQCHSLGNHRVKTVCENDKLRLQCRPKSILAIYSASYGRFLRGKPECDVLNTGEPHIGMPEWFETEMGQESCRGWHKSTTGLYLCPLASADAQQGGASSSAHGSMPHVSAECVAPDALRRVSKKCHRKGNCTVAADKATFGDPCLPGMKKQLRVSYTCGELPTEPGAQGPLVECLCPPHARQAGVWAPPGEAGTAGEEQGGDASCVLSLQCPSSCWRRWALTPRTLSCSRTTYTVMWGEEGYTTSSVAPCLCSGEPALPRFVCIPGTSLASLSHGGNHPLVSAHSEGMEVASAGSRGEEDMQGYPCGQQSTCAGRMECSMGKDRQEQAPGTTGH